MRYPIVHEEGDARVGEQIAGFSRGRVRGHDYHGAGAEGGAGEVGVVHEGDVRVQGGAGGEVELW